MPIRVATWNVYYGVVNGETALQRIQRFINNSLFDIAVFQEVPQALLPIAGNLNLPPNIAVVTMDTEYPPGTTPNSVSAVCYLIVFNTLRVTLVPNTLPFFFQPQAFVIGNNVQGRPPVQIQFVEVGTNTAFNVLTWHNEIGGIATLLNDVLGHGVNNQVAGLWIIAADLNVNANAIANPNYNGLRAVHNGVDYIITNANAIQNGICDDDYTSDAHLAVFATINL